jgi:hypothetical protein
MAVTGPNTAVFQQVPGASVLPLTLAAWVKVPHAAVAGTDHVLKLAQTSNNGVATLHYVPGGSDPDNFACGADWAAWNGTADCSAIGLVVRSNTWTLLVGTFDDGGTGNLQTIKLYVAGTLNNTSSGNSITGVDTAPADFTANIFAGDAGGGAAVAFPAIWQAVLSQAEVTALTQGQDPRVVHPANLKCLCALSPLKGSVTTQTDLVSAQPWTGSAGFSFVADPPVQYWPPPSGPPVPGTVIAPATTIDALFSAVYATRSADLVAAGTPAYSWITPQLIAAQWPALAPNISAIYARFEARSVQNSLIRQ